MAESLLGDLQVEMYAESSTLGDGWHDITSRVRADGLTGGVEISYPDRGSGDGLSEPSTCAMTLDCRDGVVWPGNPTSPYFGSLGQNTPIRVAIELFDYGFDTTVVDSWGPIGGYTVSNTGSGGTVAASNWQQNSGVGKHSVPVTSAYRQSVLTGWDMEDCEQSIDVQLPTADVTGGGIEPANLIFRLTTERQLQVRLVVNPDETITIKWLYILVGSEIDVTSTQTATITNSGQWLRVKGNVEGRRLQAKVWNRDDPEPLEWLVDEMSSTAISSQLLWRGEIGVRTGVASGNTNTKPVVVSYDNWQVRSVRFYGAISEFPLEVDNTTNDVTLPIVAAGTTRRLFQGELPVASTLRRSIPSQSGVVAYWPLEDDRGSNSFASGLSGHPPMTPMQGTPGYAEFSDLDCSQPLPTGNVATWIGDVLPYTDTGRFQVRMLLYLPSGGQTDQSILLRWYTDRPGANLWNLVYRTGGDLQLQVWRSETEFVQQSGVIDVNMDNSTRWISVDLQNDGADVDWRIMQFKLGDTGGTFTTGTFTGIQLATVKRVWVNANFLDTPAFGHVTVQDEITDLFDLIDEIEAFDNETTLARMSRLSGENDNEFTYETGADNIGMDMGKQRPGSLDTLIEECVTLDSGGILYDGRTHDGLMFRERNALYNQDPWITLSYTDKQLSPPWSPRIDDRDVRNRITVKRDEGSEATYELTTGPKSTLPPGQGGAGAYPSSVTVNAYDDSLLQQIAAFRVAAGTVADPRYPAAVVNLAAPALQAAPEIGRRLLDMRPGRVIEVTDAEAVFQHDSAFQMVAGYREYITQKLHVFDLIGVPAAPFDTFVLGDADRGRVGSDGTTIRGALTTTTTEFDLDSPRDLWTTDPAQFPFKVVAAGERMVCTDINSTVPQFLAAGAVSHADNASTTPGLPGGGTTTGDGMCLITCSRNAAVLADTANLASQGWTLRTQQSNFKIFVKTHVGGGEVAPTVTWSAGSAGDVNSSVIVSARNLNFSNLIAVTVQANSSAQNVAFPGLSGQIADGLALVVGRKSDDWTSVATVAGMTEAVDSATTVGSDQGLVVDYMAHNGSTNGMPVMNVPSGQFVVTGGASATSTSMVMIFGNRQTMTVTRSDNGVVKEHPAGTPIQIYRPARLAL